MTTNIYLLKDKLLAKVKKLRAENNRLRKINKGLSKFIGMIENHIENPPYRLNQIEYHELSDLFDKQEREANKK